MRNLSRILTVVLCCAPAFSLAAGPVATTSGSNLTAYNPSTAYNNQWATVTNGRYDSDNTTAKVDFGNCNAVVLRCAQPKCANGGCTDYSVAGAIVTGCVKSNDKCKQYGDDLVNFMTAQLVANSNAKINEQNAALEQARIQAEAQAAAAAASNTQNEQMMAQMQNQMYQMQQQMAQQQEESNRQLQEALAQQAAQSAAALESMKTAATEAAQETEAGITSYQQEAIDRGISRDVLERQKITGQIMTEIEDADLKLKAVKTAMQNSFTYAGCDSRGNNCGAPKRIKKWRELATGFLDPYDETIDKIYDALVTAQTVGVDLSQIYMMLNDSCNSWGQYICQSGTVRYPSEDDGTDVPKVCRSTEQSSQCRVDCISEFNASGKTNNDRYDKCVAKCENCQKCRLIKILNNAEDVYAGWIDTEETSDDQRTVISCASGVLNSSKLFARRTKNKNGAGLIDIDKLDNWLRQTEPSVFTDVKEALAYCFTKDQEDILKSAASSKTITKNSKLCIGMDGLKKENNKEQEEDDSCPYISGTYALCDTHPYNSGKENLEKGTNSKTIDTDEQEKMKQIIGLKITVMSQQMYKQYEYLRATLKRLQIQLEKSVLTANLAAAGAKGEDGSSGSSGLLGGGGKSASDKEIFLTGAKNCWDETSSKDAYDCILSNLNVIKSNATTNKQKAAKQLAQTADVARARSICVKLPEDATQPQCEKDCSNYTDKSAPSNTNSITKCVNTLRIAVLQKKEADEREDNRSRGLRLAY